MDDTTERDASSGADALTPTIQELLNRGQKAGNYRAALKRVLLGAEGGASTEHIQPFRAFLAARGTERVAEIDKRDLVAYAEHLADAVADAKDRSSTTDGISAATAWTYYDYVSAFLAYCVEWEFLTENPPERAPQPTYSRRDQRSRRMKRTLGTPRTAAGCSGSPSGRPVKPAAV
jgi:hypothetical protein